jgi:ferric-dicitrate binding protein FerR (iron transport regulator)
MTEEQAYILIHRHLAGEASPAERRQLEAWHNASEENRIIFDEAGKIWRKIDAPQPENVPPFEGFWQKLESKLAAETKKAPATILSLEKARQGRFFGSVSSTRWLAAAAVLIILVGATFMYQRILKTAGQRVYATRNAERLPVILPDGSRIELNAASELRFWDSTFDTLRLVTLIGQAFFEVTPGAAGLPFVVRTENAEIHVLGTSFDVRARNQNTQVVVQTGKVSLQTLTAPPESSVVLAAGQMSFVDKSALPIAPITIDSRFIAAWRQQKLVFDNTPLVEIVAELQRVYDVEITITDRELQALAITGAFDQQPVTDILASLCLTLHLKYSGSNGKYLISR